jgi:large subunit ribosomal protein L18
MLQKVEGRRRRHQRVRKHVRGSTDKPRLCVFRSSRHIYAQLIDDARGHTIVAASTMEREARGGATAGVDAARAVGRRLGERAKDAGITRAVFDRGGFRYHGRVAAVADGAREAGLAL